MLRAVFSENITPVLDILQKTSGIPSSILWENVDVRINSIYRKTLAKGLDSHKIERLNRDYYFLKNTGGDLFNLKAMLKFIVDFIKK